MSAARRVRLALPRSRGSAPSQPNVGLFAAAMPPKRKRAEPQPTPPPEAPRRSSRRTKAAAARPEDRPPGLVAEPPLDPSEAVKRAVQNLSEMERKLQSEVRRQRLAIESSDLGGGAQDTARPPDAAAAASEAQDGAVEDGGSPERGARRPPPVNSESLPLPWLGRLGYTCLNTYLRAANPPVFSSRTCRLSSVLEHRHPLQDPCRPEHPTKNRPDKSQLADVARGLAYVQAIGLSNARDIVKMVRWNDKYGIRFMRLSSDMFPFASHKDHGYKLAPFAADVLAEAGRVAAELGHRLTMHPGQFTQLGSPRHEVVDAAVRDLEYHDELLFLLKLPDQLDRDAVIIVHMGGTYGDKAATLQRFRQNYARLSDGVKRRLVLENDDVSWSVHDLLPVCEELDIPLVLDFHHHNIVFDPSMREGTLDIMGLFDRIRATWTRKSITQKMHYSEPTAAATTPRERRKHSARVKTLPPCAPDMDLMIEAKDKEQAVFELMRAFRLPGWDRFNDIVPHERDDEPRKAVKANKGSRAKDDEAEMPERVVSPESFGMGGPENRVFWPEGMEEWLRPRKREPKGHRADD